MSARAAIVALAAAAAFLGSYALGETGDGSDSKSARPPTAALEASGDKAPVSPAVPVPAPARLPGLRDAPARAARPPAQRAVRRAPSVAVNPAPAPAPVAPRPQPTPEPDPGTPFFNAE